jgi:hypothetical protein
MILVLGVDNGREESDLTFWHLNFILHTLYIKCKNTGPKKSKIMKQTAFRRERKGECAAFFKKNSVRIFFEKIKKKWRFRKFLLSYI